MYRRFRWELLNLTLSVIEKFAEVDRPLEDHLAVLLLVKVFCVCLHPFRLLPPFLTLFHSVSLVHTLHPMVVDMCLCNVSDSVSPTLPLSSI